MLDRVSKTLHESQPPLLTLLSLQSNETNTPGLFHSLQIAYYSNKNKREAPLP